MSIAQRLSWVLALALCCLSPAVLAQPIAGPNVQVELRADRAAIAPGDRFTVAFRQVIREGWHTYWRNPGDSGLPTRIEWSLPPGFEAGPIQWPAPEALPFDILVNFGYTGEVLLPVEIRAPRSLRPGGEVTLSAHAYWLVCSDICIPEDAPVSLTLPVAASGQAESQWGPRIAQTLAALPKREEGVEARITAGSPAVLSVLIPSLGDIRNPHFFPYDPTRMRAAAAQQPRVGASGLSFSLAAAGEGTLGRAPLDGVVTFESSNEGRWTRRSLEIAAVPGSALPGVGDRPASISDDFPLADLEQAAGGYETTGLGGMALLAAIGFAFLGGLILNVMPCVLPVLSVKALSLAGGAGAGAARRHGVFYAIGVLATFLTLAGLLVVFRAAGDAVGWGFQLQSPMVTGALALLFFAIGLNLLGVFTLGGDWQGAGGDLAGRAGEMGAFFTGALAVVAATPCTAPFMAGAVGAALTQTAWTTFAVFAALGAGFALPLTALAFMPGLQRLLPKPGPWMMRVKQTLAFPMFGAAVWLVWVLAQQSGAAGVAALLSLASALAFLLLAKGWGRGWAVAAVVVLLATAAFAWRPLAGLPSQERLVSEAWSPTRVQQLRSAGRPVFVNFTAAWCVTCKLNEATSLMRPRVAEAFDRRNVAYLVADWTNRDPIIAAALAEHGRVGVPLYLYYPAGGAPPVVLPQVLTEQVLLEAVSGP